VITDIIELSQLPIEGKIVLFIAWDTAPCKKFLNYARQGIEIIENREDSIKGSYFRILNSTEIKEKYRLTTMPTSIVFINGEEKLRFTGHLWSQFEIADKILEGFNK